MDNNENFSYSFRGINQNLSLSLIVLPQVGKYLEIMKQGNGRNIFEIAARKRLIEEQGNAMRFEQLESSWTNYREKKVEKS